MKLAFYLRLSLADGDLGKNNKMCIRDSQRSF